MMTLLSKEQYNVAVNGHVGRVHATRQATMQFGPKWWLHGPTIYTIKCRATPVYKKWQLHGFAWRVDHLKQRLGAIEKYQLRLVF